ncbi:MAG: hypothetical protein FWC76_01940 [Defluviitaleaceae bacterium]|nr:hypothetical protein [Defluviitaleaceae bacterium]
MPSFALFAAFLLCVLGVCLLSAAIREKYVRYVHWGSIFATGVVSALAAFLLPISPTNDSYSMALGLQELLSHGELSPDFNRPYFAFFVNNKIALVIYWGAVALAGDVEIGIRVVNFLCLFSSAFFFSAGLGKIFGEDKWRIFGLMFFLLVFPYIVLTGPYVYPISTALAAAAFYLGICKKTALKPLFFLAVGLLFLMRPTAGIFIFVYFALCGIKHFAGGEKRQGIYALCTILLMLVSIYAVQLGVGAIFYRTGLHPFPNLANGAANWTLDIGTRLDGAATGTSVYTPYGLLPEHLREDEIAIMQNRLFAYFYAGNSEDYENVVALSREIRAAISGRAVDNFLGNPSDIPRFYTYKAIRLFGTSNDHFYFYGLNATLPSFAWQAHRNIEHDSETHIMALILLFSAAFVYMGIWTVVRRKFDTMAIFALSNGLGCAAAVFVMLTLTEVGQRGLLDIFIPAAFVACSAFIFASEKLYRKMHIAASIIMIIVGLTASLTVFSANNITALKDMDVYIIRENDSLIMEITLPTDVTGEYFFTHDGQTTPLTRHTTIETTEGTWIFLHTPEHIFRIITSSRWR